MNTSKISRIKRYLILFIALSLCNEFIKAQPASPNPGENIWHSVAGIGTAVDQLSFCCATVSSKLDTLAACDSSSIFGPTTITASGNYCLASNFNASAGDGILITADNVVLDLNNKTIFGTGADNGIHIPSGVLRVTVKNGTIITMFQNGILLEGNSCLIQNCTLSENDNGLNLAGGLSNRIIANTAIGNSVAGFVFSSAQNTIVRDNQAIANGSDDSAYGFISSAGIGNLFENCVAENTITTTNGLGFVAAGFMLTATECCSKIIDCKVDNTQTPTVGFAVPYGIFLEEDFQGTTTLWTNDPSNSSVFAVDWSPDGKYLAVGDDSGVFGSVRVYLFNGRSLIQVAGETIDNTVNAIEWSSDGKFLAVGSNLPADGFELHVYEFDGTSLTLVTGITVGDQVLAVAWSPDGRYLAVGSSLTNAQIQIYAFDGNALTLVESEAHGATVRSIDWNSTQQFLAIGGSNGGGFQVRVYSFDSITGALTNVANQVHGPIVFSVNWSPNSKYLAIGGDAAVDNTTVRVFRFSGNTLTLIANALTGGKTVRSVDWTQDGEFLTAAGRISTDNGTTVQTFSFDQSALTLVESNDVIEGGPNNTANSVAWALNQLYFAVGVGTIPFVRVYKANTGNSKKCVIKNNVVSCTIGGCNMGVGINADTQRNVVLNNTSIENDRNYLFVENIYTGGLYNYPTSPTLIQNISIPPR